MRRGRPPRLSWVLLCVWSVWIHALTGLAADVDGLGRWLPDLGLVLLLALGPRMPASRMAVAAVVVALARASLGVDPPTAILAGYFAVCLVHAGLREFVDLDDPLFRALLAGVASLALSGWWVLVHAVRHPVLDGLSAAASPFAWRAALSTATVALAGADLLLRLPGLQPLWKRGRLG